MSRNGAVTGDEKQANGDHEDIGDHGRSGRKWGSRIRNVATAQDFRVSYTFGNASSKGAAGAAVPACCLALAARLRFLRCSTSHFGDVLRVLTGWKDTADTGTYLRPPPSCIRRGRRYGPRSTRPSLFRRDRTIGGRQPVHFLSVEKNWAGALNFKKNSAKQQSKQARRTFRPLCPPLGRNKSLISTVRS